MSEKPKMGPRREDTEPWYRQFWPWFLIALPGSVVIAGISTVFIAVRHADDLVVTDYYKDGLAINIELDRKRLASELGIEADLTIFERRLQVRLSGEEHGETLQLLLSHPLEADRDFQVTLYRVATGLYDAQLPATVAANWHWTLATAQENWRLDGSLSAQDFVDVERRN